MQLRTLHARYYNCRDIHDRRANCTEDVSSDTYNFVAIATAAALCVIQK